LDAAIRNSGFTFCSNVALGRIVGSGACALKTDATKAQECGAKGIGAR
jgi:hypothetical protein